MKKDMAKRISIGALSIALVCIGTMVIQIPIPLGYAHLGNAVILLVSVFFGPMAGTLAGGIGSALADLLTGFVQWVPTTLLTKSVMGLVIGLFAAQKGEARMKAPRTFGASVAGIVVMVLGYFAGGAILAGSVAAGAAQIPGLTMEGVFGIVLFYAVGFLFEKAHVARIVREM
ncbi:ECF transporter S component [Hominifimenecus sp. rT4P-3]|uniref:ECF transporter S component n=1 Tax=Hominifimenecus sp. rT4P-3 TaxID=3242979 RepID=UPI003DA2D8BC